MYHVNHVHDTLYMANIVHYPIILLYMLSKFSILCTLTFGMKFVSHVKEVNKNTPNFHFYFDISYEFFKYFSKLSLSLHTHHVYWNQHLMS